ncbi:MFS-type transporter SLC18B1-like [Paramacrobiotus metropolitanus]|uniref:MFS-type transporter SLC18B1-like n=1 Tax=Paramacrobiotus metropolitanus TaxID=2943436 RepID=UPI0024459FC5|nr:MFS-type transporter SLC18B1-like [Paramacrobiotus metropolitanus]
MGGHHSSTAAPRSTTPLIRIRRNSDDSLSSSNSSWRLASEHSTSRSLVAEPVQVEMNDSMNLQRSFSFHGSSGLRGRYLSEVKPHLYRHPEDDWEIESLNLSRLTGQQRKTIYCLWAAKLTYYITFGIQPLALPAIVEANTLLSSATGTLFATWALGVIAFWPVWRRCVNRTGTKSVLIIGMFLNGLSFLLFGCLHFEESWSRFIVMAYIFKLIEGAGFAALELAIITKTLLEFPRHESGAYGSVQTCIGIGVTIGAAIGGFLYSIADVASTFLLLGVLFFLVGLVILCVMDTRPYINPVIQESRKKKRRFLQQVSVHSAILMYFFGIFSLGALLSTLEPHISAVYDLNFTVEGILLAVIPLGFAFGMAFWQWLITHDYVCGLDCVNIFGVLVMGLTFLFLGPCEVFKLPNNLLWLNVICFLVIGGCISMVVTASLNTLLETAELKKMNKLAAYSTISTIMIIILCLGVAMGSCIGGYINQIKGFEYTTTVFAVILFIVGVLDAIYALVKTAIKLHKYNQLQAEIQAQHRMLTRHGHTNRVALMGVAQLGPVKGMSRQASKIAPNYSDRQALLDSTGRPKGRSYGTYL